METQDTNQKKKVSSQQNEAHIELRIMLTLNLITQSNVFSNYGSFQWCEMDWLHLHALESLGC